MIELRHEFNLAGFDLIEQQVNDLQDLKERWAGAMKADALKRYEELSGPALAEATQRRYQQQRKSSITVFGKVRQGFTDKFFRKLRKDAHEGRGGVRTAEDELRRILNGDLSQSVNSTARYARELEGLRKRIIKAKTTKRRVGGDRRESEGHHLLGKGGKALKRYYTEDGSGVANEIKWWKVQNEGGTVGHGANLPARTTLEMSAALSALLAEIAREHLLGIRH